MWGGPTYHDIPFTSFVFSNIPAFLLVSPLFS